MDTNLFYLIVGSFHWPLLDFQGSVHRTASFSLRLDFPADYHHQNVNIHWVLSMLEILCEVKWSEVAQSCPTLCNPMNCSLPGFSIYGIFQARVLEWVAISFSRGSSQPREQTWASCIAGRLFTNWATREAVVILKSIEMFLVSFKDQFFSFLLFRKNV